MVLLKEDGQWWWLSWHQRSAVRIPTSAKFLLNIVYCQLYRKDGKKKRQGVAHFFKRTK